jgi:recombination protein RecR
MENNNLINKLTAAFRCLPGVGPKSAQRMVFHLLQSKRSAGLKLAECLKETLLTVNHCQKCRNFTEYDICNICQDDSRDKQIICIVESPQDLDAIESSHSYKGRYFVLMGKISPIDGIGAEEIGLPSLRSYLIENNIKEIIFGLSPSIESQTTLIFIQQLISDLSITLTQLAQGIPLGGTLEFLDKHTIITALKHRYDVIE